MNDHVLIAITVIVCITALTFKFKCRHKWEVEKEVTIWDASICEDKPTGTKYILRCEKCGKVKAERL